MDLVEGIAMGRGWGRVSAVLVATSGRNEDIEMTGSVSLPSATTAVSLAGRSLKAALGNSLIRKGLAEAIFFDFDGPRFLFFAFGPLPLLPGLPVLPLAVFKSGECGASESETDSASFMITVGSWGDD